MTILHCCLGNVLCHPAKIGLPVVKGEQPYSEGASTGPIAEFVELREHPREVSDAPDKTKILPSEKI